MSGALARALAIVGGSLVIAVVTPFVVEAVIGPSVITSHGLIAIGLETFFTLALGAGLMTLLFISARSGHDDSV